MEDQTACVEAGIKRYGGSVGFLIPILQDIQRECGYLPFPALKELSKRLGVPMSRIYNVVTFYKAFNLTPRGRHTICVCTGTVCHLKGSGKLVEALSDKLGVAAGGTTGDLRFSLETVNCVGACALAPAVVVDGNYYANVKQSNVTEILKAYE